MSTKQEARHFLTVDWCNRGKRGVFCDAKGNGFSREEPLTALEMREILGPFWLILSPESTMLTDQKLAEYCWWRPLAEYSGQYGVAQRTK